MSTKHPHVKLRSAEAFEERRDPLRDALRHLMAAAWFNEA